MEFGYTILAISFVIIFVLLWDIRGDKTEEEAKRLRRENKVLKKKLQDDDDSVF